MKKKTKKLVLAKETVRTLAAPGLAGVYGGDEYSTVPTGCGSCNCTTAGCFTTGCESRVWNCFSPPTGG